MRSGTESLWLFALLASKCKSFTSINIITLFCLLGLAWFLKCLFHWAHPGGPAWGKHRWTRRRTSSSTSSNFKPTLIPGPRGLPLIGSMNLMTGLAHHKIAAAAQSSRATRLMAFSLGETRVIVTCNPDVAKQILNSSVFADRPVKESAYSLMFNRAIGFAPHGIYWRTLRKIASNHLFCVKQIRGSEGQRAVISDHMVKVFSDKRTAVCVRDVLKRASLYNMMWSVFGRRYGTGSMESMELELELELVELKKLVDQGYQLLGILNWTDHLPWLTDFDPQGVRFKCAELVPKVNRFVSRIIQEHRAQLTGHGHGHGHDFTDVLLSLQGPEKLSDSDMIAVLWEMIFRGTDTVAVLIEWILARLVLHRDAQSRVQNELDRVVGRSRGVTESDITKLVYLPAVVKEVLRLHPPGPLLSWARLATADTDVDGYQVPAGTTAMVNMWAITRDPQLWKDPLQFRPERFLDDTDGLVDLSVTGSDLRLAPFGSGRRSCPGKTLGMTTVSFWVASLLHEFEFEFESGCESEVDLSEVLKLSCEMANPLVVNLRPRRMSTS